MQEGKHFYCIKYVHQATENWYFPRLILHSKCCRELSYFLIDRSLKPAATVTKA